MKNNFSFSALFAPTLFTPAGWGMSKSMNSSNDNAELNEMALANVEALADGEWDTGCTAFSHCSTNCPYEWCGYCNGFLCTNSQTK